VSIQHKIYWSACTKCKGFGKINQRIRKKISQNIILKPCLNCSGSGLITSDKQAFPNTQEFPHIAVIGGGIGGTSLAVACLHRAIPFTIYERDSSFNARSQGYGLTLQQASKAMEGFGISNLKNGVVSTKHIVHTPDGKIVGEWGMRKWLETSEQKNF